MVDYYGVQRSEAYLQHYGIKGMHWGVRKAIETNNQEKINRLYAKAQKKLYKLNAKADVDLQKEYAKRHTRRAAIAAGIGGLGLASFIAQNSAYNKASTPTTSDTEVKKRRSRQKKVIGEGKGVYKVGEGLNQIPLPSGVWTDINGTVHMPHPALNDDIREVNNALNDAITKYMIKQATKARNLRNATRNIAAATAVGGLGTAAYQTGKAIAAKYRTTSKGHAKAVAKRDAWKREMDSAFKGTQFNQNKKRKYKDNR